MATVYPGSFLTMHDFFFGSQMSKKEAILMVN